MKNDKNQKNEIFRYMLDFPILILKIDMVGHGKIIISV